jgi:subtilisin family serine protease
MRRPLFALFTLVVTTLLVATIVVGAQAQQARQWSVTPLSPSGDVIQAPKSPTSQLAQTDPTLLGLEGSNPINVIVKLDYDSVATYAGGVEGLRATSPEVTGLSLKNNRSAVLAYTHFIANKERQIASAITARIPQAEVVASFRVAYGGLALRVPRNRIGELLAVEGVVAAQRNALKQPQTDATPSFIGATQAWNAISGPNTSGEGVILGVMDTGIWPDHPSFSDPGIDHPGGTFGCEFGDGSDPQLGDPFTCTDKLVGAYSFLDTYMTFIGALPGEFCNNDTDECSARDADGHGTHTSSTAAGSPVASAPIFGIERGPISGIAPGAHVIMYRVCLEQGCFGSDMIDAVEQAIVDGTDVMNVSIGPFGPAFSDPIALSFLDAFASGMLVSVSAGNSGPDAGTASDPGPWAITVGASTSNRHWLTTLHLAARDGATLNAVGSTVTPGATEATSTVLATDIPRYEDPLCFEALPRAKSAEGLVVVCEGRRNRLLKSFNLMNAGAAGMILLNDEDLDMFTDNHWIPTVMLPVTSREAVVDFVQAHLGVEAQWDTGARTTVQGDRMTAFSSRGPAGDFVNPDVTAPGIQILAGTTPDPHDDAIFSGPPGQFFQAIAGTSMSSPHSAGTAVLVKAANPGFTPAQIKSALMTSSVQDVLKEDGATPADPFDRGAGSIRANRAIRPTITFNETAAEYIAAASDPPGRIHFNLPSINAPTMPGEITTLRTLRNVSGAKQQVTVVTEAPDGATIQVDPTQFDLGARGMRRLQITISASELPDGQYFGQITLDVKRSGATDAVLPVAFFVQQGDVTLEHSCDPTELAAGSSAACQVTVQNFAPVAAETDLTISGPSGGEVLIQNVSDPGVPSDNGFTWSGTLSAADAPTIDAIVPGGTGFGYLPLADFGVPPNPDLGDEGIINFGVDEYLYGDEPYTSVAMTSNGYAVVGGGAEADVQFIPQTFPDPAAPNNVLGALWTDLDQSAGGETFAAILTDGTRDWIVLEWANVPSFSDNSLTNSFQIWLETSATAEGISYEYGTIEGSADPLNVGAENRDGSSGVNLGSVPATGAELSILTSPPVPGGAVTITYDALAVEPGIHEITAKMTSSVTEGTTIEVVTLTVS